MRIHALTVCVDYADRLAVTLPRWLPGLASLTVVTAKHDTATQELVRSNEWRPCRLRLSRTDAFYADGAAFNKGRAMNLALDHLVPWEDWILLFDPDIHPPADWLDQVKAAQPTPGLLYGAHRWQADNVGELESANLPRLGDREWPGYFQLFHSSDPHVQDRPLFTEWIHAGGYDSDFQNRWSEGSSAAGKVRLPLRLVHLGATGNWFGVKDDGRQMAEMYRRRRDAGGSYEHERMEGEK